MKAIGTILVSLLTALVTTAALQYISLTVPIEDLLAYYRINDLSAIGTDKIPISFFVLNRGRQSDVVEEVGLLELTGKDLDYQQCFGDKLALFVVSQTELSKGSGAHQTGQDFDFTYYRPQETYVDNVKANSSAVAVESGKIANISVIFNMTPQQNADGLTIILCPTIRYFDNSGRSRLSICAGWKRKPAPPSEFFYGVAVGADAVRLLPRPGSLLGRILGQWEDNYCATGVAELYNMRQPSK